MTGWKTLILTLLSAAGATIAWLFTDTMTFEQWWLAMQGLAAWVFLRLGLEPIREWLSGYKTYATQVIAMIGSVVAYMQGNMTLEVVIASLATAFIAMFFRAGEKKTVPVPMDSQDDYRNLKGK